MHTTQRKRTRTIAASTATLVGSGLMVAAVPAEAAVPTEPAGVVGVAQAPTQQISRASTRGALIVHRSGRVAASASIAAAPSFAPARKKAKRKHRSRRS
ncbi:MAG: hypothetical protein IPG68_06560 [Micrococcales bacterium]|nr:hypothetical protein [Micrococcales bacterium]